MKREQKRLTPIAIKNLNQPGRYADGAGLYLLVKSDGRKTWVFRWRDRITGKLRDKGLGSEWDVSLTEARASAANCRRTIRAGGDPIADPQKDRHAQRLEHARRMTFKQCRDAYIKAHRDGWRNEKHAEQWTATLDTYAADLLPLPVAEIDDAIVIKALEPIWTTKTETATRVRQRIEAVLDWAKARKLRTGENPARWRGHLEYLLAAPTVIKKVQHRPALPYGEIAEFMGRLRLRDGYSARALELQILTACRPGEVAGAMWAEIDLEGAVWTIPAARMKAHKEHRVPLSAPAVALLRKLPAVNEFVFPGQRANKCITTAAAMALLKDLQPGIVAHGFRSSFRDWAAEQTAYPREVIEHALAHQLKDKTEAAYLRTDLFAKRERLMKDWAKHCAAPRAKGANVRTLRSAAR